MKAAAFFALALMLAGGWWLWQRVGVDVALGAALSWCG